MELVISRAAGKVRVFIHVFSKAEDDVVRVGVGVALAFHDEAS